MQNFFLVPISNMIQTSRVVVESTKSESESESSGFESESESFASASESLKIWTRVRLEYTVGLEYYITGYRTKETYSKSASAHAGLLATTSAV